jgi:2-keto-4-pentenoate hydratase/2-oxohepta-3-ene-1,7-dioic acid hydratase in catechol pathway
MKLVRCLLGDAPTWAIADVEADTLTPLRSTLADWAAAANRGEDLNAYADPAGRRKLSGVRLLAPLERSSKVICAGLNYRKHVEAVGSTMPDVPIAFIKAPTAIIAHEDILRYPPICNRLDFEIELVVVMARAPKEGERPSDAILGYTIGNDVSARDLTKGPRGADLYSAKSLDDTCGVGPWIVTVDEIGLDPNLLLELRVNGEVRQHDYTGTMEYDIDTLIAYIHARTRVEPGDLIFTGTPAGVALEDGRYLVDGDVVECEIEKIGVLRNQVHGKSAKPADA